VCLVSVAERALQWFNRYALSHIAIHGDSYFTSAKKTFNMMRTFLWPALVNDTLIDPVFTFLTLFNSVAAAAIATAIIGWDTALFLGVLFAVAGVHLIVFRLIDAAVVTLFVCMAESPEVMFQANHDFYLQLQAALDLYGMGHPSAHVVPLPTNVGQTSEYRDAHAAAEATQPEATRQYNSFAVL
jgi:hypothetical protein